jgi:hypothetical protein
VAFSCERRGFCPSCGARRMVETAALLVDSILPQQPARQWVLSLPFALRYLLATRPEVTTHVLGYRAISGHLIRQAGLTRRGRKSPRAPTSPCTPASPRRHHTRDLRAGRLHGPSRCTGAQAPRPPDAIPRRVRHRHRQIGRIADLHGRRSAPSIRPTPRPRATRALAADLKHPTAAGSGSARIVTRDLPSAARLQLVSTGSDANIGPLVSSIRSSTSRIPRSGLLPVRRIASRLALRLRVDVQAVPWWNA